MDTFLLATNSKAAAFLTLGITLTSVLLYSLLQPIGKTKIGVIGNLLFLDRTYVLVWPWETLFTMDKQYIDDGQRIYHFDTMDGKKVAYSITGALEVVVRKLTAEAVRDRLDIGCQNHTSVSLEQIISGQIKRLRLKDLKSHIDLRATETGPWCDAAGVYWTGHVRLVNLNTFPETFSDGRELEYFTSQDGYKVGIGWEWTAKLVDTSAARLLSGNHNTEAIEAVVKQTLAEWVSLTPLSNLIEAVAGPKVFERHPITTQLEEDPLLWHISIRLTPKIEIVGPEPPETSDPEEEITAAEAEA